jgi:hypothetical protein
MCERKYIGENLRLHKAAIVIGAAICGQVHPRHAYMYDAAAMEFFRNARQGWISKFP